MPTFNNLDDLLSQINGSRIVQLRTKTQEVLNKKSRVDSRPNPYTQGVSKLAVRNVIIGTDYSNVVNNQLAKEEKIGDFVPEAQWRGKGRRISKFLVEHTESHKKYLAILPKTDKNNFSITKSVYVDNATGLEIDSNLLKEFKAPKYDSENQGTDKIVRWQVIEVNNIVGLKSGTLIFEKS